MPGRRRAFYLVPRKWFRGDIGEALGEERLGLWVMAVQKPWGLSANLRLVS